MRCNGLIIGKVHILDCFKFKEFADNSFRYGKKRKGETFVDTIKKKKGEIALYEQFLLFPSMFS